MALELVFAPAWVAVTLRSVVGVTWVSAVVMTVVTTELVVLGTVVAIVVRGMLTSSEGDGSVARAEVTKFVDDRIVLRVVEFTVDAKDAREAASVVNVVVFNSETTLVTEYTENDKSLTRDHHHRTYSSYTLLVYTEFFLKKKLHL